MDLAKLALAILTALTISVTNQHAGMVFVSTEKFATRILMMVATLFVLLFSPTVTRMAHALGVSPVPNVDQRMVGETLINKFVITVSALIAS
jgi:predicted membrane protein